MPIFLQSRACFVSCLKCRVFSEASFLRCRVFSNSFLDRLGRPPSRLSSDDVFQKTSARYPTSICGPRPRVEGPLALVSPQNPTPEAPFSHKPDTFGSSAGSPEARHSKPEARNGCCGASLNQFGPFRRPESHFPAMVIDFWKWLFHVSLSVLFT